MATVTEVDRRRIAWLACCQPMMTTLRRLTLNVEKNRSPSLPVKILFVYLLLCNINNILQFTSGVCVFVSSIFNSDKILFRPLNFNAPLITCSLMVFFVLRRRRIVRIIDDIVNLTSSMDSGLGRKDIRWTSKMLARVTCLYVTLDFLLGLFHVTFLHKDEYVLETYYFGFRLPEVYKMAFLKTDSMCYFTSIVPYGALHGMLLIFVFSLLLHCFRQLNRSVESTTTTSDSGPSTDCGVVYAVLRKHREIAALVTRVNGLFSLSIFFYVISAMFRVVVMIKFLAFQKKTFSIHDYTAMYFGDFITMVTLLGLALWYACRIHAEARNTTNMLFKLNLKSSSCCNCENRRRKFNECHVTSLYVAQQTVLPVGIRLGRLFCIDYPFILFVFSSIVTYMVAISAVE